MITKLELLVKGGHGLRHQLHLVSSFITLHDLSIVLHTTEVKDNNACNTIQHSLFAGYL